MLFHNLVLLSLLLRGQLRLLQWNIHQTDEAQVDVHLLRPLNAVLHGCVDDDLIHELIDHIEVNETQGEGKHKTQRIVIFYRFVGYIEIPEMALNQGITKDTRQGISVSYIPKAITA